MGGTDYLHEGDYAHCEKFARVASAPLSLSVLTSGPGQAIASMTEMCILGESDLPNFGIYHTRDQIHYFTGLHHCVN